MVEQRLFNASSRCAGSGATLPSLQPMGLPTQLPATQASSVVHALPSSHGSLLLACVHPVVGLQASSVQPLPSLQFLVVPPQTPPEQVSPTVQALPSSHGAVLLEWAQPVAGLHVSFVQTSPSLQFGGAPPVQIPATQASFRVHALPSSHGAVSKPWTQPVGAKATSPGRKV